MSKRKPKIEMYWTQIKTESNSWPAVNWRLVGANDEVMCQSTQGFRDKTDAVRSVLALLRVFGIHAESDAIGVRVTGPGRKPK